MTPLEQKKLNVHIHINQAKNGYIVTFNEIVDGNYDDNNNYIFSDLKAAVIGINELLEGLK